MFLIKKACSVHRNIGREFPEISPLKDRHSSHKMVLEPQKLAMYVGEFEDWIFDYFLGPEKESFEILGAITIFRYSANDAVTGIETIDVLVHTCYVFLGIRITL